MVENPGKSNEQIDLGQHQDKNLFTTGKSVWLKHPFIRTLFNGVLISLPLIIFLLLIYWLFKLILGVLTPITFFISPDMNVTPWYVHLFSFLILLVFFFIIGKIAQQRIGKSLVQSVEKKYLCQIPLYNMIRDTVQQFSGVKKMPFTQVVLVNPYNTGVFLTGFVTEEIKKDLFTIFVPTAPNPLNGNIYHVSKSRLIFVPIGPEAAMRTIVGMGTGSSYLFSEEKIEQLSKESSILCNE